MAEKIKRSQHGSTQESLAGRLVSFDEMREITEWHDEEGWDEAFGHFYEDFYDFYENEFPDSYAKPRVRMSEGVRSFFVRSRPNPVEVPWGAAIERIHQDKNLVAIPFFDRERKQIGYDIAAQKDKADQDQIDRGFSTLSLGEGTDLHFLFRAEIDKETNQIIFLPRIENLIGAYYGPYGTKTLLDTFSKTFDLETVNVAFPESIRVEHFVAYNSNPSKEVEGDYELSEVPVVRISFLSEPKAE